jgi:hypothetical protein
LSCPARSRAERRFAPDPAEALRSLETEQGRIVALPSPQPKQATALAAHQAGQPVHQEPASIPVAGRRVDSPLRKKTDRRQASREKAENVTASNPLCGIWSRFAGIQQRRWAKTGYLSGSSHDKPVRQSKALRSEVKLHANLLVRRNCPLRGYNYSFNQAAVPSASLTPATLCGSSFRSAATRPCPHSPAL